MSLVYDPATKLISTVDSTDTDLSEEVAQLNRLAKDLISCSTEVPESPQPSQQLGPLIKKLAESGVECMKKKKFDDAAKQFTLAIDMASRRARWEAFGVQLQELTNLVQARCDAYMMSQRYMEALGDSEMLLQMQMNTPDNFLRHVLPLMRMGRFEEAKVDLDKALQLHPDSDQIKSHIMIVRSLIAEENGDVTIKQQPRP